LLTPIIEPNERKVNPEGAEKEATRSKEVSFGFGYANRGEESGCSCINVPLFPQTTPVGTTEENKRSSKMAAPFVFSSSFL